MERQNNSTDYGLAMRKLIDQTFEQQRYKEMNMALRVLLYIFTWPLFVMMLAFIGLYLVTYFIFRVLRTPIDYLLEFIHKEGKEVMHATQFIIYLIAFPTLFLFQLFITLIAVELFLIYFATNVCATLWSLGGTQFVPFMSDDTERIPLPKAKNVNATALIDLLIIVIPVVLCFITGLILCFVTEPYIGLIVMFALSISVSYVSYLFLGFDKDGTPSRKNAALGKDSNKRDAQPKVEQEPQAQPETQSTEVEEPKQENWKDVDDDLPEYSKEENK